MIIEEETTHCMSNIAARINMEKSYQKSTNHIVSVLKKSKSGKIWFETYSLTLSLLIYIRMTNLIFLRT